MKKTGILNAELMSELTKLRHMDQFVICDAGFPVPQGANIVDVSLIAGVPSFMLTLKAVLNELIVEDYVIFDFMKEYNTETYDELKKIFCKQTAREVSMEEFIELSKNVKLFIRTGELKPASNILLTSASGADVKCRPLDISFDQNEILQETYNDMQKYTK